MLGKEIRHLYERKAGQQKDIAVRIIKRNSGVFSELVMITFNNAIISGKIPNSLTCANVKPVSKKDSRNEKEK